MFGNKSLPSKNYLYGAREPMEGLDVIREQMHKAHVYQNKLVELERTRREKISQALSKLSPKLAKVEGLLEKIEADAETLRRGIRIRRQVAQKRTKAEPSTLVTLADLSAERRKLRAERKELRSKAFDSKRWKKEQDQINEWAKVEGKRLRSESGCYWGAYLPVEQAMQSARKGPPPQFRRWDGSGRLAAQLQGGLSPETALALTDTQVRVELHPEGVWVPGRNRPRRLGTALLWLRVGSDAKKKPVWAKIPFHCHRPLPEDATIKWVTLHRERIGTHDRWSVMFTLSREADWDQGDRATTGSVGIDVGWRKMDDGRLRVAYWVGSDGEEGELSLSPLWVSGMRKVEDIQSIRDGLLNDAKALLLPRLVELREWDLLPEWFTEATKTISHWVTYGKFASLALKWREARFEGDEETFDDLEAWRERDKHLLEYEDNLRDRLQAQRKDAYRCFAATIRRRYATVLVENMDLRDFHVLPESESEDLKIKTLIRDACVSSLRQCLQESARFYVLQPAANTTRICHDCGERNVGWDQRVLFHECQKCGVQWDQDRNAAINLLRA